MENKNDLLKNDILVLIMDFLYSNDLIDSLITIEKETKQSIFSYNKELLYKEIGMKHKIFCFL